MPNDRISRRRMIEKCIANGMLVAGVAGMSQQSLLAGWEQSTGRTIVPTPGEVLGPFYKKGAPNVRVLRRQGDPGTPLRVAGQVWNSRGDVVPNAAVEVWHADYFGRYDIDGYRFRSRITPDANGAYALETVMPGTYEDRPVKHIHYMISAPGHETLITQAYFATDPFFEGDPVGNYNKFDIVQSRELVRPVTYHDGESGGIAEIDFSIVLERA